MRYPFKYIHYFIPEFLERMRNRSEYGYKPSIRQGINIGNLLLPAFYRQGYLRFEDILNAVVVTSRLEYQELAEEIAVQILVNVDINGDNYRIIEGEDLYSQLSHIEESNSQITIYEESQEQDYLPDYKTDVEILKAYENKPDIGVGPGEDRILKKGAKIIRSDIDHHLKNILMGLLKNKLLKLGKEFERKDISRSISVKPYQQGEDPLFIDEERSLENILDLGRKINEIRHEDFLMINKKKKKRSIIYLLDISNTMFYELDGINSINYSILCLVPLIWGLKNEKEGILLYESNTHILKDIYKKHNIEPILEELIQMLSDTTKDMEKKYSGTQGAMTWGGTVPNMSLKYAYDNLTQLKDRSDKFCFIFSDFVLSDPSKKTNKSMEIFDMIKKMVDYEIKIVCCVSPLSFKPIFKTYTETTIKKLKKKGCKIIQTKNTNKFLKNVKDIIDY
jgi:hypothetical protein